jgi:hypothetical protein
MTSGASLSPCRSRSARPSRAAVTRFGYGPISTFSVLTVLEHGSAPETPIWARLLCD